MIFFSADTHFSSQRTLTLSRRPYATVAEMDQDFIKRWNETVKDNDIVYHLGDFGNYNIIRQLNGDIYLLLGNYERIDIEQSKISFDNFRQQLLEQGFKEVYNDKYITIQDNYHLMHEPEHHKLIFDNKFILFGHIHQLCMIKRYGLNVGIDCHNYKPINLDVVNFYQNAVNNHYDCNVFE